MNFQNMNNMQFNTEESMYPEAYHKIAPIVDQLIREMERQHGDIFLNEDLLNQMVEEAMRRSGMDSMPSSSGAAGVSAEQDGDAVPTINEFGRHGGRDRHRDRDRDRNRDRDAFSDIFRILFLQQLFGRRRPRWRWR